MSHQARPDWERTARTRRLTLTALVLLPTLSAVQAMAGVLPHRGGTWLEAVMVVFYGALFAWISIGFWAAMSGLIILARRVDRFSLANLDVPRTPPGRARTAILLPVAGEEVARVFAGLRATYLSVQREGRIGDFDFFVLSDTSDPDTWIEEEAAWDSLCQELKARGRIFYRRRRVNLKRKSGNIADFCRRWGRLYPYMVVFDADSVMTGQALGRLVDLMEANPSIGIIQTAPAIVGRMTLLARVQQFSSRLYGPMFAAGLNFWQLGDSQFWGHNAIIRVKPFMDHCGLPKLPGRPPLGGAILSHDFVEAALMRRAGFEVWLAYDLGGSFEEMPPTLLAELKRDRRWAQGNMQHVRLLFARVLIPAHRALFLNGAMAYGSALLWLVFLCLSTAEALVEALSPTRYFPAGRALFPQWPTWQPRWALILLFTTMIILFLPKVLSLTLLLADRERSRLFGGRLKASSSVLGEIVVSSLLAPVRMLFHSRFVFSTLIGREVGWGAQERGDRPTSASEALRFHGSGMLLGLVWAGALYLLNRPFLWWNLPVLIPLILAAPLSMLTSLPSLGASAKRAGLFLIPEEVQTPLELSGLDQWAPPPPARAGWRGFARAVVDPSTHSLHLGIIRGERTLSPGIISRRRQLAARALELGPTGLTPSEKRELLVDASMLSWLHHMVWQTEDPGIASAWGVDSRA